MANWKKYKDDLHGLKACSKSKTMAWGIIRSECHRLKIEVPTIDMIKEI